MKLLLPFLLGLVISTHAALVPFYNEVRSQTCSHSNR